MKPMQAVLLAGGQYQPMHPLTRPAVHALLPVVNAPLLKFPLELLIQAEITHVIVVANGEEATVQVSNWLAKEYSMPGSSFTYEVIKAADSCGTAEALRLALPAITADSFIVLSGDLVTDVPLKAVLLQHRLREALATVLLSKARAVEKKLGKAPQNVDYIGLTSPHNHLVFHAVGHQQLKDLKLLRAVQRRCGRVDIHTDLQDSHLYVFSRSVLDVIAKPTMTSLSQDVMPYLVKMQFRGADLLNGEETAGQSDDTDGEADAKPDGDLELPGARYMDMSHADEQQTTSRVQVYFAEKQYCARVNTVAAFLEVNKEVAASKSMLALMGIELSGGSDNKVSSTCTLGNKATVGSGCILGENNVIGDKTSVKRSILGNNCKLGREVKLINCVLMDNVTVGNCCQLQNTILCAGAGVGDDSSLKDCQVGPGYQVASTTDLKDSVLARSA